MPQSRVICRAFNFAALMSTACLVLIVLAGVESLYRYEYSFYYGDELTITIPTDSGPYNFQNFDEKLTVRLRRAALECYLLHDGWNTGVVERIPNWKIDRHDPIQPEILADLSPKADFQFMGTIYHLRASQYTYLRIPLWPGVVISGILPMIWGIRRMRNRRDRGTDYC